MRTIIVILVILVSCAPCCALDVTSHLAVDPNFDQAMATLIVQENTYLTVNPGANTQIAGTGQSSEPRAAGFFTGGNTAAGTLLPKCGVSRRGIFGWNWVRCRHRSHDRPGR